MAGGGACQEVRLQVADGHGREVLVMARQDRQRAANNGRRGVWSFIFHGVSVPHSGTDVANSCCHASVHVRLLVQGDHMPGGKAGLG